MLAFGRITRDVSILVGLALLAILPFAYTANAWTCLPGFSDTPENQHSGACVEVTPTPFHGHATETPVVNHTPTSVPHPTDTPVSSDTPVVHETPVVDHTPTSVPTPTDVPMSDVPTSVVSSPPSTQASGSQTFPSTASVHVCHYEPTQGWLLESKTPFAGFNELPLGPSTSSPLSDYRPVGGVCATPPTVVPTSVVSVALVASTPTPVPTVAPTPTDVPTVAPTVVATVVEVPTMTPTTMPTPISPPVQVPSGWPSTGDGSTSDEFTP